jgi:carboxyl-terminal processing protease
MFRHTPYLIVGILLAIALFTAISDGGKGSNYFALLKNINLYANLYREVNRSYVDNVEPAQLMRIGIDSMLKSLDPYTNYITESQLENARLQQDESNADIGVELNKQGEYVVIQDVYEDLPAQKAGLKQGDKILAVNGMSAKGRTIDDVKQILRGQPGSDVKLSIQRKDAEQTLVAKRDKAEPKNVPYFGLLDDGKTGYVKLTVFKQNCAMEVQNAIEELKDKGMTQLIFDLRHNGGGLLNEAINIVNLFVPKDQLVVSTKGRDDEWNKEYKTQKEPLIADMPVAVLVDERSASASEIVSGTIQDLDRGIVIGQRSFGKGLVQQTKQLGYNSQLKLTVAKYYTPSGRCVQAIDYYGTYKDGATAVPDSLKKAFKTRNGRIVYDGSGVEPDINIPKPDESKVVKALQDNLHIFDYATYYFHKNPQIVAAKAYQFTDADFDDFAKFLSDKNYDYSTQTEETAKKIRKAAEREKAEKTIDASLTQLENRIKQEKQKDLYRHKDQLKLLLKQEIIGRYYFQKGRVEAGLKTDPNVQKAQELFANNTEYNKILKVGGK